MKAILFLFSQYMSAMKIEDLLDPKEDSLPGGLPRILCEDSLTISTKP